MTTEIPITLHVPELRPKDGSLRGIWNHLVENMVASADTIIDAEEQLPTALRVNQVVINAAPSVVRTQTLPEQDGTIALLDDVYGPRPTVVLPEGLVTIDWLAGDNFLIFLERHRDSAIYMAHSASGMDISIVLVNNGTVSDVPDWDASIQWPSGVAPSVPPATAGQSALQRVNLFNVSGTIFGESFNYSGGPFPIP